MEVIIFVDNSNIFIGGKNKHGREARFSYEKCVKTVCGGDTLTKKWIFGQLSGRDSFWEYMKGHDWEVTVFDGPFGRGEKQVDTSIIAEGVDLIARSITSGRLVLLSGDKDFLPLINKAKQYKWSVQLWAYEQVCRKNCQWHVICQLFRRTRRIPVFLKGRWFNRNI